MLNNSSYSFFALCAEPQNAPLNLSLTVDDANCVAMSWDPPAFPNGEILEYEVRAKTQQFYCQVITNYHSFYVLNIFLFHNKR